MQKKIIMKHGNKAVRIVIAMISGIKCDTEYYGNGGDYRGDMMDTIILVMILMMPITVVVMMFIFTMMMMTIMTIMVVKKMIMIKTKKRGVVVDVIAVMEVA